MKVRRLGRVVSVAVIIAVGVKGDGRREVLGLEVGTSEAEPVWTAFLRKLTRRAARTLRRLCRSSDRRMVACSIGELLLYQESALTEDR
jgi:transposase-like protein